MRAATAESAAARRAFNTPAALVVRVVGSVRVGLGPGGGGASVTRPAPGSAGPVLSRPGPPAGGGPLERSAAAGRVGWSGRRVPFARLLLVAVVRVTTRKAWAN